MVAAANCASIAVRKLLNLSGESRSAGKKQGFNAPRLQCEEIAKVIFGVIEVEGINISLHREVRHWARSASCARPLVQLRFDARR